MQLTIPLADVQLDTMGHSTCKFTPSEQRRMAFLGVLGRGGSQAQAHKVSGLSHHDTMRRLLLKVAETGTIKDRPRSGRPTIFSDGQLEQAVKVLIEVPNQFYTGPGLVARLAEDGDVAPTVHVGNFIKRLRGYLERQGHKLSNGRRATIFLIKRTDAPTRVAWCIHMLEVLQHTPMSRFCFLDEVTIEESPHPKGMYLCKLASYSTTFTTGATFGSVNPSRRHSQRHSLLPAAWQCAAVDAEWVHQH